MSQRMTATADKNMVIPVALLIMLGGAFMLAFYPAIAGLVHVWGSSDDYSHGFLIVPLSLYILWQKRDCLAPAPTAGHWSGLVVACMALLVYLFASFGRVLTLSPLAMIGFVFGSVIFLFGYRVFAVASFPLALLLFMVPIPGQIYAALTIPLQLLVTKFSTGMAGMIGIPVFREGNVIHLSQGTFEVVQACSGLRSIMALLTIGAVLGYFSLRSNLLRSVLFVAGVPVAIVVNIMRVFVLIAALHYFGVDLSEGTPHTILGMAVFVVAIGIFILLGKGLSRCER